MATRQLVTPSPGCGLVFFLLAEAVQGRAAVFEEAEVDQLLFGFVERSVGQGVGDFAKEDVGEFFASAMDQHADRAGVDRFAERLAEPFGQLGRSRVGMFDAIAEHRVVGLARVLFDLLEMLPTALEQLGAPADAKQLIIGALRRRRAARRRWSASGFRSVVSFCGADSRRSAGRRRSSRTRGNGRARDRLCRTRRGQT